MQEHPARRRVVAAHAHAPITPGASGLIATSFRAGKTAREIAELVERRFGLRLNHTTISRHARAIGGDVAAAARARSKTAKRATTALREPWARAALALEVPSSSRPTFVEGRLLPAEPPTRLTFETAILRLLDASKTSTGVEHPIYKARYQHDGEADYRLTDEGGSFAVFDVTQETLEEEERVAAARVEARRAQEAKEAAMEKGKEIFKRTFEEAQARAVRLLDRWYGESLRGLDEAAKEAAAAKRDDFLEQAGLGRLDYRSRDHRARYTAREAAANAAWDATYRSKAPSRGLVGFTAQMDEQAAIDHADLAWARVWRREPLLIPEQKYRPATTVIGPTPVGVTQGAST